MILYFVTACHNDARPVIERYGMKKDMSPCPFTVFTAADVVLCISGSGRANAAAATAYLLTRWGKDGLFVHMGPSIEKLEHSLYHHSISNDGETVYQEMLYKTPSFMREGILENGEALYAFSAAARFLSLNQIIVLRTGKGCNEGIFIWLETICVSLKAFGMTAFPTSMLKKKHWNIL